jgi:hypothetical protein
VSRAKKQDPEIFSSECTYETSYDIQARKVAAALGYDVHQSEGKEIARKIVLKSLKNRGAP